MISTAVGSVLSLTALAALAAPPVAPVVSTSADIKQLHFDWSIVPRSNYYEFWFKANNGAPYVKFSELQPWQPSATNNISAHLLDWDQARYQVKACNFSGCSASADIAVHDRMFESIGYFKSSGVYRDGGFGIGAAISEDGQTIAAFSGKEPVAGDNIAAVYIFTKVNGAWQQQRRIVPSTTTPGRVNVGTGVGWVRLALSADGNRLVTSMPVCTARGGDCYQLLSIWNRNGTTWTREYQIVGQQFIADGSAALLNEAGDRLVYRGSFIQPVTLLERTAAGWVAHAPIPALPSDLGCTRVQLSGDGSTLAYACSHTRNGTTHLLIAKAPDWAITQDFVVDWPQGHGFGGLAIDHGGAVVALGSSTFTDAPVGGDPTEVHVYRIAGSTLTTSIVHPGSWTIPMFGFYGRAIALSRDGALLAVNDGRDSGQGLGVLSPPLQSGTLRSGATYVYELRSTGPRLRRVLKPNAVPRAERVDDTVSFANNGKSLLIADPGDASNATGIDGNRNNTALPGAGALWLY